MNGDERFEHFLIDVLAQAAPSREPDRLVPEILRAAHRERRRPRWLALVKEPSMRLSTRVVVGSPAARVVYLAVVLTLVLLVGAGTVAVGLSVLGGPRTIVVDIAGHGNAATITEGVAMADDGDTVLVRPGTYAESVRIAEDITVRGDGAPGEVVLRFAEDGPPVRTFAGDIPYGFLLVDTQATVSDITVNGPNAGVGFALVAGAPTLERVVVDLDGEYAGRPHVPFMLANLPAATIRGSRGLGGLLWGEFDLSEFEGVVGTGRLTIQHNVLDQGISARLSDGSLIADNTVNGYISIVELVGGGAAEIAHNDAVTIEIQGDGTGVTVRDNTLNGGSEGRGVGMLLGLGSPLIEGNTIFDTQVAVQVGVGATPTIKSNQITGNAIGIKVEGDTEVPVIVGNTFCGNDRDLVVPESSSLTLEGNTLGCEGLPSPSA